MSDSNSRRRGAATIDLVLCSVRQGRMHVLVVKSERAATLPFRWANDGASLEATAQELARTYTGHTAAWLTAGTATASKRHPASAALSVPFIGVVGPAAAARAHSAWHPLDALPVLAPRHRTMVDLALDTLRLHMDLAPVAFRLLAPAFTLAELQQAYELLLGRQLHKASFRRALQSAYLVAPTDEWRSEGRGRPAQLFRYAPSKRRGAHRSVRFDLLRG